MAFREVRVFEVREVLRLWVAGEGLRSIDRLTGVEPKTVRRYVQAASAAGVHRGGGDGQLTDEVIGLIVEAVRSHRSDGRGASWRTIAAHHDRVAGWVETDLTAVKIHELWPYEWLLSVRNKGAGAVHSTAKSSCGLVHRSIQRSSGGRWRAVIIDVHPRDHRDLT